MQNNSYPLGIEQGAETARLVDQDTVLTRNMGALFPVPVDSNTEWSVLDLGCGPGGWVLEVASAYPEMTVIGVDLSKTMLDYARALAQVKLLHNVEFTLMDVTAPLAYADATFDFVNGRLLSSFMRQTSWQPALREWTRILVPYGVFCFTEPAWPRTNSPAFETYTNLTLRALWLSGQSPTPDEERAGITPFMAGFLQSADYQDIQQAEHVLDFSTGGDGHQAWYENCKIAFKLLQPFLLKMNVTNKEEIEALYEQALSDMFSGRFEGVLTFLSAWGRKPGAR
ncbi:MAG TPA: class I SAM-dependent methyltransferase [Ktedonobacteraceae bacterium]|nr:class I SAM-dependent methyltransferase [Ktedonobacteraceae bacterium]